MNRNRSIYHKALKLEHKLNGQSGIWIFLPPTRNAGKKFLLADEKPTYSGHLTVTTASSLLFCYR